MIDLTSAVILILVGTCLTKIFRKIWPKDNLQTLSFKRLVILSLRIDQLNRYINEVAVKAGHMSREEADYYKQRLAKLDRVADNVKRRFQ